MPPKASGKAAKNRKAKRTFPRRWKEGSHKRKESYAIYIYKVLEASSPDTGVSSKAMFHHELFVNDIFERIAAEASVLPTTTETPSPLGKSNCSPSLLSRRIGQTRVSEEPRLSPSTPPPSKFHPH
ncbi:Histone H2B 1 [Orchesella cincta]|uniref:Histone H2B 1 n=1 Tax=Orchesella cincta TaxID=48709 RepID=A0A1D2M175_ORCCI|nr:Histone H2B 1 [Orchesella cincta]